MLEAAMRVDVHSWAIGREKRSWNAEISVLALSFAVQETLFEK